MSWRHDQITDLDLMAYADGQLDAARRQAVELFLAASPEDALMVEAIMEQNADLRVALSGVAKEAVPDRLMAVLERERRPRPILRPALKAAALAALMIMSGLGGWWVGHDPRPMPPAFLAVAPGPIDGEAAAVIKTMGMGGIEEAVETALPSRTDRLGLRLAAPDIDLAELAVAELLEMGGRPTLQLRLAESGGRSLALYLQTRRTAEPATVRLVEAGAGYPGPAAYWQDGPLVWALTGDVAAAELSALAEELAAAMLLEPDFASLDAELIDHAAPAPGVQLTADDPVVLPRLELPVLQSLPIELVGG